MSSGASGFLGLRGTFHLPELTAQGLLYRLGDGRIAHSIPIDEAHIIIHTDTSVFLRSLPAQETLWEIDCPSFHFAIDLPHNLLALVLEDTTIMLWNLRTGQLMHRLTYRAEDAEYRVNPNGIEFNFDGSILAVGMRAHNKYVVVLWSTTDGHLIRVLPIDDGYADITTLAFHPGGNLLVGGSFNNSKVWFWQLSDGSLCHIWEPESLEDDSHDRPYDLAFSHDGAHLFVGRGTWGLRIWDVESMQEIAGPVSPGDLQPSWLAVDPCGRFLAVTHESVRDSSLRVFEIGTWQIAYEVRGSMSRPSFNSNGRFLAVGTSTTGCAYLLETATGKELLQLTAHNFCGISQMLSSDGHVLVGAGNGKACLWSTADGTLLQTFSPQKNWSVMDVAFDPDTCLLAASAQYGFQQFLIHLWNTSDGRLLCSLQGHTWSVLCLVFSPDGRMLASGSTDKTLRIWDLERKQERYNCVGHLQAIKSIAFAPNGAIVVSGSLDQTLCLWNVEDGTCLGKLIGHKCGVLSIAFSPDGLLLASGDQDGRIRLWSVIEQTQIGHWQAHTEGVNSLAFSPDGRFLVSASDDRTARLWDYAHGEECYCLYPYQGRIEKVAFTVNGQTLMTGAINCVRFWRVGALSK
ncbi:hypothetical protein KDA_30090 [Dictyobacter alpinus]|uniref:Uncharacterized protein n=1 Tax=Dictyobacter alpinus TaxID=2014873 RepID=A0A402B844_9CHLR|nr:WD40 repeat domain-containing protein [Dictyobacter alpinus]GCE27525.1 hypothetical protein KDA_30090 [Dictyobacter alpinus]